MPLPKPLWQQIADKLKQLIDQHPARQTDEDPTTGQIESVYAKFKQANDRRAHLAYTTPAAAGYQWICEISLYDGPNWQHFLVYPDETIRHAHGDDRDLTEISQAEADALLDELKNLAGLI